MAAVIGPIGVDHAHFGERGASALAAEIFLAERRVVRVHGERVFFDERFEPLCVEVEKSFERLHAGRHGVVDFERFGFMQRRFAAFHGVDHMALHRLDLFLGEVAVKRIDLCRANNGAVAHGNELNALRGGIGALIELPRQILDGKRTRARKVDPLARRVHLRFGKNGIHALLEQFFFDIFRVVTVDNADLFYGNAQNFAHVGKQRARLVIEPRFLFYINSVNHLFLQITLMRQALWRRYPRACRHVRTERPRQARKRLLPPLRAYRVRRPRRAPFPPR